MEKGIHHMGLAGKNLEEVFRFFKDVFGAEIKDYEMIGDRFICPKSSQ